MLQRARERKEEYGDFLVSTEHLLLGFNLDNRIGKQLYKEGNAIDISFKILDDRGYEEVPGVHEPRGNL